MPNIKVVFWLIVSAELYVFSDHMDEIKKICEKHVVLLIEDTVEAMGATVDCKQFGSFGRCFQCQLK